jgi:ribosomal-protein-alanine N-acetyltransferase
VRAVARLEAIETARLICERLGPEHATELAALLQDQRVARTLSPHDGTPDGRRVSEILARHLDHWDRNGFGLWMLRDRASGEMVGRGGLMRTAVTGTEEVEVGWAIVPERWGEGLATELAHASVDRAFRDLRLSTVIAYSLVDNTASRRVMEKAGFIYEREFEHHSLPHVVYRSAQAG